MDRGWKTWCVWTSVDRESDYRSGRQSNIFTTTRRVSPTGSDRPSRAATLLSPVGRIPETSEMQPDCFRTANGERVPAITADEMRTVDRLAVEEIGLSLLQMMEHAGRNLARAALAVDADR